MKIKVFIKNFLHFLLARNKEFADLRVLSGPAKGIKLRLDLRKEGSYFLGTYDKWLFSRIDLNLYLKPGMIAWDCGAYIGYYSAIFRKHVGEKGAVYTFEASRKNYNAVKNVPIINKWDNMHVINCAVGPDHSTIKFADNLGGSNGPVGLTKQYSEEINSIEVQCCGVDELVLEMHIPAPDFIKFDLETAEEFALHNGEFVFSKKRPFLLLELHGNLAMEKAGTFLEKYNYQAVLVWEMPTPTRHFNTLEELKELNYVPHMIFCQPR